MITRRFVMLYVNGSARQVLKEFDMSGNTDEECLEEAYALAMDTIRVEFADKPKEEK